MKITVGKIKKRKIILLNFVILLFVVWWLGVFFIMYKHFYERIMFFGVLIIILLLIYSFVLPGIVFANTMWEVDQKYLRYIYFDKNLDKARYLYSFLFKNKYPRYQINLKLSQIDFVQISYYRYSFYPSKYLVNGSGNKIVFKFNMLDGSQYIIENLVSSDKETFSKGIELMKKNGVRFVDSYHLLDIIRSNKNLDQYIVAIENGSAKLNVENLLSGTYDVLVRFMGDNNYLPSENNASFIVSKVPTNMNIAVDNINVGEDAVINITLPNEISNELVSVTIDGKSYTVLINNGKGSLILSNLVANSYPITAKYDGNYKYTEGENTTALTVAKMSSAVNVTANNIKFGEEAVINIAVPNVSLGVATVVVNGKSYNVAIVDEKGVLNIYNLAAGDYNVDVTYLGDNKYLSSTNAANFTVSKVSDYNMTVDIADIVKGENATITVSVPEDGTGNVIVTINGTDYKGTVVNGTAKVIIPGLDEGTYKVVTFYTGDNKYDSMIVNGTITVNKNTKTTLTMDNLVKYFNGPQKLMAKLVDGFGNPIANATVYFTINGKVYARITDENGTASIAIRLLPGEYKASALFNGTDDYDMAAVNASVLVKNTILGNDTTLYFRNGTQYVAKFLDGNGKALANTDVKFNINGVFYTRVTDENGIARLNIRLDPASYIITAYNPVTGEQKANNITVLPRIIAKDLSMKYLDGSTFNAALVDGQGKAISGVNITFNINGVFYHRTTDVNGVASLNIRLISGVYIITSMYDECWASNKIIISA